MGEYHSVYLKDQTEYEAKAFASQLLIDDDELLALARQGYTAGQIATAFNVDQSILLIKCKEMQKLGTDILLPEEPDHLFFRKIHTS